MDRDGIVFWTCLALGGASLPLEGCCTYPNRPLPEKTHSERCAAHARDAEWIRAHGAPLNVGTEQALAKVEADARREGCP